MWMSQQLSPASSSLVGVHAGGYLIVNLWSVPILKRSHDYLCSYVPIDFPRGRRKNVPNTRQSTTVIARLCFPIHVRKDSSMVEARCGAVAERPMTVRTGMYGGTNLGLWSGRQTRHSTAMSHYPSCAKASRSFFSCSSGRLVEMISKS
jgi:hypothetical protein